MKRSSQHEKKAGVYRGLLKIGHKRCFSRGIIRNGINFQVCNLWYFDKKPLVDKCWHSNAVPILRQSFVKLIPQKKRANCHVLPCLSMANLWVRSGVLGERLSPRTRAFGANSQVAEAVACFRDFFWMILLGITMGVFYWYLMGKPWDYIFLDESFEISKNNHNHQIIIITFLSFSYTTW